MIILNKKDFLPKATAFIFDRLKEKTPLVIAIDGGSGAGKSTIIEPLAERTKATVIPLDDFFSADIPNATWDSFSKIEKLDRVFQWERLIKTVLQPLMNGHVASFSTFDFSSVQADGTYLQHSELKTLDSAKIIIIEGAYSASPSLEDFIDIAILIDVSSEERHRRLFNRENSEFLDDWHKRWDIVENYYFDQVKPKESYDIVINNSDE